MHHSYQLVRHPAVLKRLREEVMSFTQDDVKLTRAHIAKMKYLKCVLNESEYSVKYSINYYMPEQARANS